MSAEEVFTWDRAIADGGAFRPSEDSVGIDDAGFLDDDEAPPPRDGTELYAAAVNQVWRQVPALAKVAPCAIIDVEITAGVPAVVSVNCPSKLLVAADFTPTDNGVGDTSITWTASVLPPSASKPQASINGLVPGMIASERITNGVRVVTQDAAAVASDRNFTVHVY